MKPMIETKKMRKVSIAMLLLITMVASGYTQGLLIEGAAKLFNAIRNTENVSEYSAIHTNRLFKDEAQKTGYSINILANFSEKSLKEVQEATTYHEGFYPKVIASFNIGGLEITYENEIAIESWMTETFSNELEEFQSVEPWMTESFSNELEEFQSVEPWMTESFSNELEEFQSVEPWMTESFSNELEEFQSVEPWMTIKFSEKLESGIEVEDWMITPLYVTVEEILQIEEWMMQPLI